MNILHRCKGGGIHLLHTQKNNRIWQIAPFTQLHCRPECLVCGICPFCPEELPALLRGEYAFLTETPRRGYQNFYGDCPEELPALLRGEYAFLTETPREGGTKILRRLRGGYAFFTGFFQKITTPQTRNSEQSLRATVVPESLGTPLGFYLSREHPRAGFYTRPAPI